MFEIVRGISVAAIELFNQMSAYLLFGFFFAGILHVLFPIDAFARHLGKSNISSVIKAVIFGIPLPLCSCGVIPAAVLLRKRGASRGAVLSFLVATPITGVDSRIHHVVFTYLRTFGLFGRTANLLFNLPYTWGTTDGLVEGDSVNRDLSGLADANARLSINLLGAPTLDVAAFRQLRAQPRTVIGASLQIQVPIGAYEADKLINVGANRWGIKPALGLVWPIARTWLLEFELGAWFYSDNGDFLGKTRTQDPIVATQFHLIKRIRPGFWASLDANFYTGGRTTVNQALKADLQRNSRLGVTLLLPFKGAHAMRGSYSTGVVTESGGDFEMFTLSYLFAWQ